MQSKCRWDEMSLRCYVYIVMCCWNNNAEKISEKCSESKFGEKKGEKLTKGNIVAANTCVNQ